MEAFFMEQILVILLSILCILTVIGLVFLVKYIKTSNQSAASLGQKQMELISKLNDKIDGINQTSVLIQNESKYNELMPLIYQQINKLEGYINDFQFENQKGYHAINLVTSKINLLQKELFNKIKFTSEDEFRANQLIESKKIITQKAVVLLLDYTVNTIASIHEMVELASIPQAKKQLVYKVFSMNFNDSFYDFLKKIGEISRKKIKPVSPDQLNATNILDHQIKSNSISKKTKEILDFRNQSLTNQ